jgi:chromate transporter
MHKELVEKNAWIQDRNFLGALSFCMLLPGPEAMQLATYTGWKLRGTLGGLIGGLLFVLPGALVILALAALYVSFGQLNSMQTAFVGVKAAIVVILAQALWSLSKRALPSATTWGIAAVSFGAIYAIDLSFVVVIALSACLGALLLRSKAEPQPQTIRPRFATILPHVIVWPLLWAAPIAGVWALDQSFLTEIGVFFSKLAVVTFGGAYAVLAYMTQTVSQDFGWLTTSQMIDALALAETTPGPLILVTEFVALVAGYQTGGTTLMLAAGALALWCTFIPCFLWIFVAAPYVDRILAQPRLKAALAGISAAVVGVILNLSLWFAEQTYLNAPKGTPVFEIMGVTLSMLAVMCTALAIAALIFAKRSIPLALFLCGASSLVLANLF